MVKVVRLPDARWGDYRELRLEALQNDPLAFGSSYEEEVNLSEDEWERRIRNVLFATDRGVLVGMISCVFNSRMKTKHIASIYGFYVKPGNRGKGIGERLLGAALSEARKKLIVKVQLSVNPLMVPAVKLYERAGFQVIGTARQELRIGGKFYDMLLMEKIC